MLPRRFQKVLTMQSQSIDVLFEEKAEIGTDEEVITAVVVYDVNSAESFAEAKLWIARMSHVRCTLIFQS